jgi:hypothetical protein
MLRAAAARERERTRTVMDSAAGRTPALSRKKIESCTFTLENIDNPESVKILELDLHDTCNMAAAYTRHGLVWVSLLFVLPIAAGIDRSGLPHQCWASKGVNVDVRCSTSWVRLSHSAAVLLPHELAIRSSPWLNVYCPQRHIYGYSLAHDGEERSPSTSAVASLLTTIRGGGSSSAAHLAGVLLRALWQNPLLVLCECLFK